MGIGQSKDFDTSKLNSFWSVIVLSHDPIDTFVGKFVQPFINNSEWCRFVSHRNVVQCVPVVTFQFSYHPRNRLDDRLCLTKAPQNSSIWSNIDPAVQRDHTVILILDYFCCHCLRLPNCQFHNVSCLCNVLGLWTNTLDRNLLIQPRAGHTVILHKKQLFHFFWRTNVPKHADGLLVNIIVIDYEPPNMYVNLLPFCDSGQFVRSIVKSVLVCIYLLLIPGNDVHSLFNIV